MPPLRSYINISNDLESLRASIRHSDQLSSDDCKKLAAELAYTCTTLMEKATAVAAAEVKRVLSNAPDTSTDQGLDARLGNG
jgi:hypothetical protein